MVDSKTGATPQYNFRSGLRETEGTIIREYAAKKVLYEYSEEDGVYNPEVLDLLGVADADQAEQLDALLDASEAILKDIEYITGIAVVPFQRTEVDSEGRVELEVRKVIPVENTADAEKLSYVPGVAEYYHHVFEKIEAYAQGDREDPVLYHTDLARPSQYIFGSIGEEEPRMYLVDLDPEITTAVERYGDRVEVDLYFLNTVTELAAVSHGIMDGHEAVEQLIESIKQSGFVDRAHIKHMEDALRTGQTYLRDPEELAIPRY